MSVGTLAVSDFGLDRLGAGKPEWCRDSDGRQVLLYLEGYRPGNVDHGVLEVMLDVAAVRFLEENRGGLEVHDVLVSSWWSVRVGAER